jgi:hypothetical protein
LTTHGLKVLTAGKEVNVCAPVAQTGTEVAAQSTRTHERNTHGLRL